MDLCITWIIETRIKFHGGVIIFAYDIRFRHMISRWKGIIEEINFTASIIPFTIIELDRS